MAVIKAVNSKASIGKAINYITKESKTEERLISGKDCNPSTAIDEMKATKELWNKTDGRQYTHLIQSFNPKDKITPEKAHELGKKFIDNTEKFKGHEVVIATHKDKDHIHNHFIVNSVNYENGLKLHTNKKELQSLKEHSNKLSREHGLTVPRKGDKITTFNQKKYKAIEKGVTGKEKSYILETAKNISKSLKKATDKESFIKDMESKGYQVNWKDTRKYITFTTPEGKKVRNSNLEKTLKQSKFSKEGIENELRRNREQGRTTGRDKQLERGASESIRKILFNGRAPEGNSSRTSNSNQPNESKFRAKEENREEQSRITGEYKQNIQRTKSGNERFERNELRGNQEYISSNTRGTKKESGEPTKDIKSNKGHGILSKTDTQPKLERENQAIRNSTSDNNRSNSGNTRSLSASNSFDGILRSLSNAIDKATKIEKNKVEQEKIKSKKQYKEKLNPKSKDYDIDRGR